MYLLQYNTIQYNTIQCNAMQYLHFTWQMFLAISYFTDMPHYIYISIVTFSANFMRLYIVNVRFHPLSDYGIWIKLL